MTMLYDNYGRQINYVRLAVTDRCNLRCFYCMPENIRFVNKKSLLSFEELHRLVKVMAGMGVSKVRITGGEPFVRTDLIKLLDKILSTDGIDKIAITTNGVLTESFLPELQRLGINSINLSLDTLDRNKFHQITRRDDFDKVWSTFNKMLDMGFKVKINTVVMEGKNTEDILSLAGLAEKYPVDVRFIEEMPFNGSGNRLKTLEWDYIRIMEEVKRNYAISPVVSAKSSTSINYMSDDWLGKVGVIPAYSRTFCGSCNRIRINAVGKMRTCLYSEDGLDLRDVLRQKDVSDENIQQAIRMAVKDKAKNGIQAEVDRLNSPVSESMSLVGG